MFEIFNNKKKMKLAIVEKYRKNYLIEHFTFIKQILIVFFKLYSLKIRKTND